MAKGFLLSAALILTACGPLAGLPAANNAPDAEAAVGQPAPTPRPTGGEVASPTDRVTFAAPLADAVFNVSNLTAAWDGQETTGGLWVALPHLRSHRRVLVTNPETGRAVVAKLYWRDPGAGEALLSSAAAEALGAAPGEAAALDAAILKGG